MTYRILVTGGRKWADKAIIRHALLAVWKAAGSPPDVVLVSGGCPTGADAYAETVGAAYGFTVERHPADWAKYHKAAGPIRNKEMVQAGADVCVAFFMPGSVGTANCMRLAEKAGIPIKVYAEFGET